jgi:hypothetical protein
MLPSKLSRCSQVHSEYAPSTPLSTFSSTLPNMLSSTLPIALGGTPPAYLAQRSQVQSQAGRPSQSQLIICSHVRPACSIQRVAELQMPGTRRREAGGGGWWVAGGGRLAAYGGRNHDVGRYHSLNLIFSVATATGSHDTSRSWC